MDKHSLRTLAESFIEADREKELLDTLNRNRQSNPELFVKTLFKLGQKLGREKGLPFFKQFNFSKEEFALMFLEVKRKEGWTLEEAKEILDEWNDESKTKPIGEELFLSALKAFRKEKPSWKKSDFMRYAQTRIESYFEKKPKPFTEEDVKVGAKWYNNTRKKIFDEKQKNDSRSRSRSNLHQKEWSEFYKLRFKTEKPKFARNFERKVRKEATKLQREAAKLQNDQAAPNRAK